jgi:hypothetical protein
MPMLVAFDFPTPFTTMGKRSVSNVPAQALALLNNPFVLQQAERWGRQIAAENNLGPTERIQRMFMTAFGRPPTNTELADCLSFLRGAGLRPATSPAASPQPWADLAHVLLNAKDFLFIE